MASVAIYSAGAMERSAPKEHALQMAGSCEKVHAIRGKWRSISDVFSTMFRRPNMSSVKSWEEYVLRVGHERI